MGDMETRSDPSLFSLSPCLVFSLSRSRGFQRLLLFRFGQTEHGIVAAKSRLFFLEQRLFFGKCGFLFRQFAARLGRFGLFTFQSRQFLTCGSACILGVADRLGVGGEPAAAQSFDAVLGSRVLGPEKNILAILLQGQRSLDQMTRL